MSTRKIRECLEYMRRQHGSGTMEDALKELEAVEKAAKWIVSRSQDPALAIEHMTTMARISEDAP